MNLKGIHIRFIFKIIKDLYYNILISLAATIKFERPDLRRVMAVTTKALPMPLSSNSGFFPCMFSPLLPHLLPSCLSLSL